MSSYILTRTKEIAAVIGKSEAATKKQLTRLLHRLREQYRRRELETPIPGLLEPTLPAFVSVLLVIYAFSPSMTDSVGIRQNLLMRIHPVSAHAE